MKYRFKIQLLCVCAIVFVVSCSKEILEPLEENEAASGGALGLGGGVSSCV